jgi:hypothetical protein
VIGPECAPPGVAGLGPRRPGRPNPKGALPGVAGLGPRRPGRATPKDCRPAGVPLGTVDQARAARARRTVSSSSPPVNGLARQAAAPAEAASRATLSEA